MKRKYLLLGLLISVSMTAIGQDDAFKGTEEKLKAALESDIRTDKDKERDRNRLPIETLKFFDFRDNLKVIELIPGQGWYTKLLAPVLSDKGKLYVAMRTDNVEKDLLTQAGFEKVEVLDVGVKPTPHEDTYYSNIEPFEYGVKDMDMVLTFRNYHNFTQPARENINQAVFKALKPGGIYGVVDHTRRHMEGENPENDRRVDPVQVIKDAIKAGFEYVDYSKLHYRPDDELRYEVGRKTVTGNSDRFTLYFKKPE